MGSDEWIELEEGLPESFLREAVKMGMEERG